MYDLCQWNERHFFKPIDATFHWFDAKINTNRMGRFLYRVVNTLRLFTKHLIKCLASKRGIKFNATCAQAHHLYDHNTWWIRKIMFRHSDEAMTCWVFVRAWNTRWPRIAIDVSPCDVTQFVIVFWIDDATLGRPSSILRNDWRRSRITLPQDAIFFYIIA